MAKTKVNVNLTQDRDGAYVSADYLTYTVVKTTNTTSPKIGDDLTERDVTDLIRRNVTVTITAAK
tara:strand:+ start:72 stop:266 length:195 start_codon:yes stop_codon:yes gene_type:complete